MNALLLYPSSLNMTFKSTEGALHDPETNGFELISNKKQLTSYAGLDIREKQSGTSIKRKS